MYLHGNGVPQNDELGIKWWTLTAEQGDRFTQHWLGKMYATGDRVPQNSKAAARWFTLAAEQGLAEAAK